MSIRQHQGFPHIGPWARSGSAGRTRPEPQLRGWGHTTHPLLSVLPFATMLAVAVIDVMTGPEVGYLPLFSLGPAFACVTGTVLWSAGVGAVAAVLCMGSAWYDGLLSSRRFTVAMLAIAGVTAAAALAALLRRRQERELAQVRSVAEAAQRVLLRPVPRRAGHLRIAVSYTSATAEARIGGDLYEVVTTVDGRTRVIVGDVQGKGLDAVETAAIVLGAFREAAPEESLLASIGARIERALSRRLEGEEFVTAILAEVGAGHDVSMLVFGHPPPLIVRRDGTASFARLPEEAPPLGLAVPGLSEPVVLRITLERGDQLLFYTDGVSEARNRRGEFYPLAERAPLLHAADPDQALEALRKDLLEHTAGPLHDDAAMLLLRRRSDVSAANGEVVALPTRPVQEADGQRPAR